MTHDEARRMPAHDEPRRVPPHDALSRALFGGAVLSAPDAHGVVSGHATTRSGRAVGVVGIAGGEPVGVDAAILLAGHVLDHLARGGDTPLVVLVDTDSQRMARRDELLGLPEYLSHLAKSLILCSLSGQRTVGLLHGKAAAGAFIATALATDVLVALEGAAPSVMDLPSIARVTKLPAEKLEAMAKTTPIFAPGIDPLFATGAVFERWDHPDSYADRLDALLVDARSHHTDRRDVLGAERGGRKLAATLARQVAEQAAEHCVEHG
jgi:malonate decarboxylase gamma subunit